jgi:hypothetical protein
MTSPIDPALSPDEISAIAEEAYVFAFPMMIAYGFFHRQTMGPDTPEKQAIGRFTHFRVLGSPTFNNVIPWINTDTLYSAAWLDLRREPVVLSVPAFEAHRFQNVQAADWYTMNFFTRGTRDVGNCARTYLLAGPGWSGPTPPGVDEVVTADSWIIKLFTRIIVEGPDDGPAIHALQDQYGLTPLSQFLGRPAPPPSPELDLPVPSASGMRGRGFFEQPTPDFIATFNALMTQAEVHPDETAVFERFARLGAIPGAPFDVTALTADQASAVQAGIDAGLARIEHRLANLDTPVNGWVYPMDLRGGRDRLTGNPAAYLARAVAARYAIWGPGAEEVIYIVAEVDAAGAPLDGAVAAYELTFDRAPPVDGFWSYTIYDAATRLLVPHASGRYKRGDRDADIRRNADGGFTLLLQNGPPGEDRAGDWLPVPAGRFQVVGRLYGPHAALLSRAYVPPPLVQIATAPFDG